MNRKEMLYTALQTGLMCQYLLIEDESHHHHVPKDAQSHFKIIAVSKDFSDLTRIARHRKVNALVQSSFRSGLHALSLQLYTPEEWLKITPLQSPACRDGYNK